MSDVILLDGGMGQELIKRTHLDPTPLWSAYVMEKDPVIVRDLHADFIRAGAKVITLNTYSVTPHRLRAYSDEARFLPLQMRAVELALAARDAVGQEVAFAGCLPPLTGSYLTEQQMPYDEMLAAYRELVEVQAPHVDAFLCETMSMAIEGKAAAAAAKESGKPVWLAWSLADDDKTLRNGETITAAMAALDGLEVDIVLANCTTPESVDKAIGELATFDVPFGAYANGFTNIAETFVPGKTVEELSTRTDLGPQKHTKFAMGWVKNGATIVGGCCEVGPDHITHLHDALIDAGHTPVTGVN